MLNPQPTLPKNTTTITEIHRPHDRRRRRLRRLTQLFPPAGAKRNREL